MGLYSISVLGAAFLRAPLWPVAHSISLLFPNRGSFPGFAMVLRGGGCETVAEFEACVYGNCRNACFPSACAAGPKHWCANTQRFLFDELETLRAAEPVKPGCLKLCVSRPVASARVNTCVDQLSPAAVWCSGGSTCALSCKVRGDAGTPFSVQVLGFPT